MKKLKKTSFSKKLLASYLMVSLLTLTVFAAVIFWHTANQTRDNQFQALKNGAHALKASIDSYMHSVDMMLSSVHADANVQNYLRNDTPSATQNDVHSALLMLDVFTRRTSGIQIFSAKRTDLFPYNQISQIHQAVFSNVGVQDERWYQQTEQADGLTCWYYDANGDLDHVPCFYASRMIFNTRRPTERLGVIRISVAYSIMQNLLDLSFYSEGSAALVVGDQPVISTLDAFGEDESLLSLIKDQNGSGDLMQSPEYFAVSVPLSYRGWYVLVLLPRQVLMQKQLSYLYPILAMWSVMFIVTLIYSGLIASHLSKPLKNLYDKMMLFGSVNNISIDEETGEEIAYLFKAFNAMVGRIDALVEKEKENEIRMLQSQINPHFVYNTLESLRAMATVRGEGDLAEMIGTFGGYFRESLNNGCFYSTIRHELNHAASYLKIQHLRYPALFCWKIDVEENICGYYVPHAVLQPLIENAIMHGFEGITEGGMIHIAGRSEGDEIFLTVSDNGCGADLDELNAMAHAEDAEEFCCIRNIWLRLRRFSPQAAMRYFMNEQGGLTVEMRFGKREDMPKESIR